MGSSPSFTNRPRPRKNLQERDMCEFCDWAKLLDEIKEMCAQGGYEFADTTLTGIYDRVKLVSHATEKQKQAVKNIKRSRKPRMERR
jgi:hypothetical protein